MVHSNCYKQVSIGWEAIRIARMLSSSQYCIAFTGAGISTAAGIGDYRGKLGKWTSCDLQDFLQDSKFYIIDQSYCH